MSVRTYAGVSRTQLLKRLPGRRCDVCGHRLATKRGHGFVSPSGRSLVCGGCAIPRPVKVWSEET